MSSIHPSVSIPANCRIGDGVEVMQHAYIGEGSCLGSEVRIGPNAVLADWQTGHDHGQEKSHGPAIGDGVVIGANAVVLPGVVVGNGAVVEAGSVVFDNVPPNAVVQGNPARIMRYAGATSALPRVQAGPDSSGQRPAVSSTQVAGVSIHYFPVMRDIRGELTVGEFSKDIPFVPKRYFLAYGVPSKETRGEHAHRTCHQFLICVRGSCAMVADDGKSRVEILLDSADKGVYLPPMIWGIQYKYSADAMLLVFASDYYDDSDYIRDYREFLRQVRHI